MEGSRMTAIRTAFAASLLTLTALVQTAAPADKIFDPGVMHQTLLVMDPADWKSLQDNFRENQYYAANVSIDGDVIEQIGVRSRGAGSRSGTKPAVKLDFNKYVKGQHFHGLKSVAVKNLVQDVSMLRDFLAMSVFEGMGLPAPAYSFTRLTVNGEYWGVYNLVESIDGPFVSARFGESDGNVIKYDYSVPYDFGDRGGDAAAYVPAPFKPETNEETFNGDALVKFIQAANGGTDEALVAELSKYTDVPRLLTYLGIENALAETDGFLGAEGMNNFYFYQLNGTTKFVIIPWDKNTSFKAAQWPILNNVDRNILAKRLLGIAAQKQIYLDAAKSAATRFVNLGFLGPKLDAAFTLIRNDVLADTKKPFSNQAFEDGVNGLRGVIDGRRADVFAQAP
jgi:spore coat protein CotH